MSEQLEKILISAEHIKNKFLKNFNPTIALIIEKDFDVLQGIKIVGEISFDKIPEQIENGVPNNIRILFAKCEGKDILIYNGRHHYYDGVSMRDIGHMIYVLRYLGIKNLISIDEVGHLNPRYNCGEIALIYDHINLAGDNPLIGKNDNVLGLRFPDMSNAYDKDLYNKVYNVLKEKMLRINESVYLGTIGPQSETDVEARFYREIGSDVVGYSMVPENITSVHASMKFIGIGLITRNLVADKMLEDERTEKQRNKDQKECLKKASKELEKVLRSIIKLV